MKQIFASYRILDWQCIFVSALYICPSVASAFHSVYLKSKCQSYCGSFKGNVPFFLASIKIFLFTFVFNSFTVSCLSVISWFLFCLGPLSIWNLWNNVFNSFGEIFSHYLFEYCSHFILSLLSFCETSVSCMLDL